MMVPEMTLLFESIKKSGKLLPTKGTSTLLYAPAPRLPLSATLSLKSSAEATDSPERLSEAAPVLWSSTKTALSVPVAKAISLKLRAPARLPALALELALSRVGLVNRNQLPPPSGLRPSERPSRESAVLISLTTVVPSGSVR